jgi:hypothetical protein
MRQKGNQGGARGRRRSEREWMQFAFYSTIIMASEDEVQLPQTAPMEKLIQDAKLRDIWHAQQHFSQWIHCHPPLE